MFKWIICIKKQWAEHKNMKYPDITSTIHGIFWELRFFWLWGNFTYATNVIGSTEILSPNYELTHLINSRKTSNADFGK